MKNIDELSHEERQELLQQQKNYGLVLLVTGIVALCAVTGGLWTVIGAAAIGAGIAVSLGFFIGAALLFQTVAKIEEVDILAESLHQPAFTADEIMAMAGGAEAEDEDEEHDPYAHEDQETRRIRAEIKSGAAKYHKEGVSLMLLFKGRENGKDATPLDEMSSVKLALLYQQKQTIVKIFLTIGILLFVILTGALWTTIGPAALAVGIVVSVGFFVWAVVIYKQMKDIKEVNTLSQSFHNKGMGEEFFKEHVALPDVEELEAEPDLEQGGGNGSTKTATTIAHASEDEESSPDAVPVVVAAAAVACAVEDVPTASSSSTTSSTIPPSSSSPPHHGDEKALAAIAHNNHAMTKQKMNTSRSSSAAEPKCEDEVDYERKLALAETAIRAAEDVKQKNKNKKKAEKTDAELDEELKIMKDAKKAIAAAEKARKKSIASKKTRKRVQEHEAQAEKEAQAQKQEQEQ